MMTDVFENRVEPHVFQSSRPVLVTGESTVRQLRTHDGET
jgi:hypothetical protein